MREFDRWLEIGKTHKCDDIKLSDKVRADWSNSRGSCRHCQGCQGPFLFFSFSLQYGILIISLSLFFPLSITTRSSIIFYLTSRSFGFISRCNYSFPLLATLQGIIGLLSTYFSARLGSIAAATESVAIAINSQCRSCYGIEPTNTWLYGPLLMFWRSQSQYRIGNLDRRVAADTGRKMVGRR